MNISQIYHFKLRSGAEAKQNKYENSFKLHLKMKFLSYSFNNLVNFNFANNISVSICLF